MFVSDAIPSVPAPAAPPGVDTAGERSESAAVTGVDGGTAGGSTATADGFLRMPAGVPGWFYPRAGARGSARARLVEAGELLRLVRVAAERLVRVGHRSDSLNLRRKTAAVGRWRNSDALS